MNTTSYKVLVVVSERPKDGLLFTSSRHTDRIERKKEQKKSTLEVPLIDYEK